MSSARSPLSPTSLVAVSVLGQGVGTAFIGFFVVPGEAPFVALLANVFCMLVPVAYLCFASAKRPLPRTRRSLALVAGLNISTAATFVLYFIAVTLISPSASTVVEAGIGPLVLLVAGALGIVNRTPRFQTVVTVTLTLIVAGTTVYILFFEKEISELDQALGATFSILAGIGSVSSVVIFRALVRQGVAPMVINACRFPLAIVVSALLCFVPASITTHPWFVPENYLLALVAIALPILVLQLGIGHLAPIRTALFLSTLPAIVFTTETILTRAVDIPLLVFSLLIVAVSIAGVLIQSHLDRARGRMPKVEPIPLD